MTKNPDDLSLNYYLVAFLDVLGQRENLRQLTRLPRTPSEYSETERLLRNTVGIVLGLRKTFHEYFESFANLKLPVSGGDEALRRRVEMAMHQAIGFRVFSDSFIISVTLKSEDEPLAQAIGIFNALISACFVMIVAFKSSHPIRGGIDVGLGMDIAPGETYGPALERAHYLESCAAKHPRLLIGNELWEYLSVGETVPATNPISKIVREMTHMAKDLVITDSDGQKILDYLGPNFSKHAPQNFGNDLIRPAYEFVRQQHEFWRSNGNEKLSERYNSVRQYFEPRLQSWGVTPSKS